MKEMGCKVEEEKSNGVKPVENEITAEAPRKKNITPTLKPKYYDDDYSPNPILGSFKSMIIAVLAALLTGAAYYYMSSRSAVLKPANKGLTASVNVQASIVDVYDYLSTPDFRTEWHFGAVEINGPAIDHSAITGAFSWMIFLGPLKSRFVWPVAAVSHPMPQARYSPRYCT